MKQKGFTLVELLVVMAITGVFGAMGFAGFDNYRKAQVLQTSSNEVATVVNLARSRAQSQIKPVSSCSGTLNGYRIVISSSLKDYTLYVSCNGTVNPSDDVEIAQQDKTLPAGVTFSSNPSFFFPVRTGGVIPASGGTIVVNYASKSKTITIDSLGGVSVQ
jgi:prepilin-type N-terminal cleavage/methylation domain-containing protein